MDDRDLLRHYADTASDAAFRELVVRYGPLVYSAARRQVGDAYAADVAQEAFLKLASQAGRISAGVQLGPWLYAVTRNAAVDVIRRENARRRREQTAAELAAANSEPSVWSCVAPVLDEAMARLTAEDRQILVLRFLEGRKLSEVGRALNVTEDGAQKRVGRALDRLEALLAGRGIKAGAAALAADLSLHAIEAVPAGWTELICGQVGAALSRTAALSAVKSGMRFLGRNWTAGALTVGLAVAVWQGIIRYRRSAEIDATRRSVVALRAEYLRLAGELHRAEQAAAATQAADLASATSGDPETDRRWRRLIEWVQAMKLRFATRPEQRIAELSYLTAGDWVELASEEVDKPADPGGDKALSTIRTRAKNRFAESLQRALYDYLAQSHERLPKSARALVPYFKLPVDPTILGRYEVLLPGAIAPSGENKPLLREKEDPVIFPEDNVVIMDRHGWGMGMAHSIQINSPLDQALDEAAQAFALDHPGTTVPGTASLVPYVRNQAIMPAITQLDKIQRLGQSLQHDQWVATEAYRALHYGAYPPNDLATLPYFSDPKKAADFVEFQSYIVEP